MNYVMSLIVLIAFLIVLGYLIIKVKESILLWHKNNQQETNIIRVIVLDKRIQNNVPILNDSSYVQIDEDLAKEDDLCNDEDNNSNTYFLYCKNIQTKEKLVFQIKIQYYQKIQVQSEGILTYQGTRFKRFIII
jgi:hypothetical protein